MSKKIFLLKKKLSYLQRKFNRTEKKILKGRLMTFKELTANQKISALRKSLDDNIRENQAIRKKIFLLEKTRAKKKEFKNTYKLRNSLIAKINNLKIKITELEYTSNNKED